MTMLKYIDLFAGIGGFHCALDQFDNTICVYSSEINIDAQSVYKANFPHTNLHGDIHLIESKLAIPKDFDLLCAGFPCQPFSKSGNLKGFEDTRGTLFFDILEILEKHRPKYVLLENVANLASHDGGNTYKRITDSLRHLGYNVPNSPCIISPHDIGIPVLRPRVYIPAVLNSTIKHNLQLTPINKNSYDGLNYFNFKENKKLQISATQNRILEIWDEFYQGVNIKTIGFPVWFDSLNTSRFFPTKYKWKNNFILKNMELYKTNREFIDLWKKKHPEIINYPKSYRKFEWQCGNDCKSVFDGFIQFRPSGIRIKRPTVFSTQVAINQGQIIGKFKRRLSANEAKKLQSFPDTFKMHQDEKLAFKHLGNSVNVEVVKFILSELLNVEDKKIPL